MTAEEQKVDGQNTIPMEGEDISPKKDGGILKVKFPCFAATLYFNQLANSRLTPTDWANTSCGVACPVS